MKGNFGGLRERTNYYRVGEICPMFQRSMVRAKTAIIRRLSYKMSIVHPWMFCFDLHMPHEVFDLLNKEILDLTRFGVEAEDTPDSGTIYNIFSNLRRLSIISSTSSKIVVGLENNLVKEKVRQS